MTMNPDHRILAIVNNQPSAELIKSIRSMSRTIVRKRSYATEVDFHTTDVQASLRDLGNISIVLDFRDIGEADRKYDEEYFRAVAEMEEEIMDEAREMFAQERYWEAHTVLEDLWKISAGPKKKLLQGVIIMAASLTHHQMGEKDVSERMYRKALHLIKQGSGLSPFQYGYSDRFTYPCQFPEVFRELPEHR